MAWLYICWQGVCSHPREAAVCQREEQELEEAVEEEEEAEFSVGRSPRGFLLVALFTA